MNDLDFVYKQVDEIFLLMNEALRQDEVPASALTFHGNRILSKNYNLTKTKKSSLAHSEILCIEETANIIGSERLSGISLISSLEPCIMCLGAISQARIQAVYYLCPSESGVGLKDLPAIAKRFARNKGINHIPKIVFIPDYEDRIKKIMKDFFNSKRK